MDKEIELKDRDIPKGDKVADSQGSKSVRHYICFKK